MIGAFANVDVDVGAMGAEIAMGAEDAEAVARGAVVDAGAAHPRANAATSARVTVHTTVTGCVPRKNPKPLRESSVGDTECAPHLASTTAPSPHFARNS